MALKRRGERGRRKAPGLSTVRSELQARAPSVATGTQPPTEEAKREAEKAEETPLPSWEHLGTLESLEGSVGGAKEELDRVLARIERLHEPVGCDSLAFELLFYLYLVVHLFLQNYNVYKDNTSNYNVSLLLLTMMTLCKRIMLKYLSSTGGVAVQVARGAHTVLTLALIATVTFNSVVFIVQLFLGHPLVNFLFLFYPSLLSVFVFGVGGGKERRGSGRAVMRRISKLVYSSMEYAYYVGVLPLRFLQHDYLYYDLGRCALLVAFVFLNTLVMLLAHMLQASFMDLYMQAQVLGRWEPYRAVGSEEKPKALARDWSVEDGPYARGEVVSYQGRLYVAQNAQNTMRPGGILLPTLLYIMFNNPNRTHLLLVGVQGLVVTAQLGLLITSNHWEVYGVMLAFSYVVMYYCVRTRRKNMVLFHQYSFESYGAAVPEQWPMPGHYTALLQEASQSSESPRCQGSPWG